MKERCGWAQGDLYEQYHDTEWGVPVHDDRTLFEFIVLEGAQAGLSWSTILNKRLHYRKAFDNFDPRKVARYDIGRGTPIAWLITLTRSRAIDRLRARSVRGQNATVPLDTPVSSRTADQGPSPYETQADQELRIAVGNAITSLPAAQQQAIELAYYDGLSHNEIAARLNQPLGTVKTRIKLGMSKLREVLRRSWEQGDLG